MKLDAHEVEKMIEEQKEFFYSGQTKEIEFRKKQLAKLKRAIQEHEKEILKALNLDLGKSEFEAYSNEVGFVLNSIRHMLNNIDEWAKPVDVRTPFHFQPAKSFIVREPYGAVLIIGPYNYPFQLVMEPLIGALIGGNTAIVKPSEAAIHTTEIIKKIIEDTFESRYVRVVEGGEEEVNLLIHAPFDYIFFTGSVSVGKIVMRAAAENLTPVTLELGGKSPAIVDESADLDVAAKRIVWGKFNNAGQTCVAPDYVLVHSSIHDRFIQRLKKTIVRFYGKDPQKSKDYGRIINERHFDRLAKLLQSEKHNIVFGGRADRSDLYMEPTIFKNIRWDSPIMEDEIFGPLLPVIQYEDLAAAIGRIRKLPKPLAAYLFSENGRHIDYFIRELPFGGGCINDTVTHVANIHLPFGGVGPSGINRYHGKASFETFTHAKSIMKRSSKFANDLLYPPYNQKVKLVRKVLK
ncbi:aldehyde dehydrogenase [Ureibacillus terrenus]|uniref:Aldehyde dehydrogenase n=1 Tax=Ureibacillus terrenus TaxID=118246 RepID=A0A540V3M6_9BACL|nr:aldehyde dehydrogenase [Ureibacillus terrenus]TQE91324.1 aldehyde dehydrogenase [Ureibacillus terrenus]